MSFKKKVFEWPPNEAKEAKNKHGQKGPILKSYYECHMLGIQKTKNDQKIQIQRGCTGLKIQHFY